MRAAARRLLAASLALCATAASAGEQAGQRLDVELHAVADAARRSFEPGEPLALTLRMVDLVDGEALAGLHPAGFVRARRAGGSTCQEAAQAYRATGRVALGDIDLAGVTLLVGRTDGMLAAVDPSTSLASANIRWLARAGLDGAPLVHPGSGRIVAGGSGLREIDASDGSAKEIAGLPKDAEVLGFGEDGRTLFAAVPGAGEVLAVDLDAKRLARRLPVPGEVKALREGGGLVAVLADGGRQLVLIDGDTGERRAEHRLAAPAAALAWSGPAAAFLVAEGAALAIVHADAPARIERVPLAGEAERVAVSADEKTAYAYAPESGLVSVVDLVRQRFAQALHFPEGIAALASTRDTLVVLLARRWAAAGISTDSLKAGRSPNVTEVRLPDGGALPGALPGPLMTAVGPLGPVLVAQPGMNEVYVMPHEAGMRAPTNAIPIRGGTVGSIAVQARSFEETGDAYRAVFSVPRAGRFEAVVSAGLLNATACLAFDVGTPEAERPPQRLALELPGHSRRGEMVDATVRVAPATPQPGTSVDLVVISANDNFQDAHSAVLSGDGSARFALRFPHPGLFIVSATARQGARAVSRTVEQIEVR